MRHGKKFNHLGRKKGHRSALLSNMANSLIEYKRIKTTLAKAKALRFYVEPLITKSKANTTHSRRVVFSYLQSKQAIEELFGTIAEKIGERPGGYTRVIRTGFRKGDGAEMAMIELVDFNLTLLDSSSDDTKKKGTRRGRRKSSSEGVPTNIVEKATAVAAPIAAVAAPMATAEEE